MYTRQVHIFYDYSQQLYLHFKINYLFLTYYLLNIFVIIYIQTIQSNYISIYI